MRTLNLKQSVRNFANRPLLTSRQNAINIDGEDSWGLVSLVAGFLLQ